MYYLYIRINIVYTDSISHAVTRWIEKIAIYFCHIQKMKNDIDSMQPSVSWNFLKEMIKTEESNK
jgi:hypothetical protein